MGRLSTSDRLRANAKPTLAPALQEGEHLDQCSHCGQTVDRRNLGDVLHHEQAGHDPLQVGAQQPRLKFIEPLLPVLSEQPPEGDRWLHEIKHDGYRTQIHVEPAGVRIYTRNGHDWSDRYLNLAKPAAEMPCESAILDGEVIIQDPEGRSDFHGLKAAIQQNSCHLVFMAFDLLHIDGRDLRRLALEERRGELAALLGENDPSRPIHLSEGIVGSGAELFAAADAMGLEGVVSKRLESRYRSGPSKDWLKTKCFSEEDLVVIGTARGDRAPVALLARERDGVLEYAGGAMITLGQRERDTFWDTVKALEAKHPPIAMKPRKEASWVHPQMRVRVRTLRGEEMLRHATVKALLYLGRSSG